MSYEGYTEYLTESGRYFTLGDDYGYGPKYPDFVKTDPIKWFHAVDVTNGYDKSDSNCCDAVKKEQQHMDEWCVDHYGNRYAIKIPLYTPVSSAWRHVRKNKNN